MKKNILIFVSFIILILTPHLTNADCELPEDLPAPPPEFDQVWSQTAQKLDILHRDLIKLWECPTAYPYILIGGKRGYVLFYPIKQYGRNIYKSCMWVTSFIYKKENWQFHKVFYLDEDLENDGFHGLYLSIIMNENYDWNEP